MPNLPLCTTGICKHNTKSETWTFWTQGLIHTKPTSNVSAATKANCRVTSFKRKTSTFWTADIQTIVMIKQHLSTISHYFQSDKKLDILNELAFLLRFSSQLATQNALQHLPHSLFTYRQRRPCKVRPAHHEQFNMLWHAVRESNQRPSDYWNIHSASWAAVATHYTAESQRKKRRDRTKMGEIIDIPATSSRSFPFPFIFLFLFLCTD